MQWSSICYWQTKPLSVTHYLLQLPVSAAEQIDSSFCSHCFFSSPNAIDHCLVTVDAACPSSSHPVLHLSPFADAIDCYFSQSLLKSWPVYKPTESLNMSKEKTPYSFSFSAPQKCLNARVLASDYFSLTYLISCGKKEQWSLRN